MNPATADLVKAVEAVGSDQVVILPNNKNIRPVAEQVDALSDKTVQVVATGSIVEGFAALLAYDPAADRDDERRRHGRVGRPRRPRRGDPRRARLDRPTPARSTRATGSASPATASSRSPTTSCVCTRLLLSRLLDESHELVTLIEGEGARVADTRRIEEWLSEEYPDVALEVHHGGQPLYPYLLGIE